MMPIPFRLDYAIEKIVEEERAEKQAIRKLAGLRLKSSEAARVWPLILEHKWYISERLGRDTGLKVAAIDYFENIYVWPARYQRQESLPPRLRWLAPLSRAAWREI
jgi:hypothetical protein